MNRTFIRIILGIMGVCWGFYPVLAQSGAEQRKTVSRIQGSSSLYDETNIPGTPIGIPGSLIDVRYRRCPLHHKRGNLKFAAIYSGKVYHFCTNECVAKFWENPQAAILKMRNTTEVPLTITNSDERCSGEGNQASREFFRVHGKSITFYCSAACRDNDRRQRPRGPVSRQKIPETT